MKKSKIITILFIIFNIILGYFSNVRLYAEESTDLYTSILEIDSNQDEFFTGSEIVVYVGTTLSGSASSIKNGKIIVTIPKEWLDSKHNKGTGIKASPAFSLKKNPIVTSDDENYYIEFLFKPISAGSIIKIPFSFKTKNTVTPDKSRVKITSKLLNGDTILAENEVSVINRSTQHFATYGHDERFYDLKRDDGVTNTPADPQENKTIRLPIKYQASALGGGLGFFRSNKSKITVRLQDDPKIFFDPNEGINSSWDYNADTKTLTKIIDSPYDATQTHYQYIDFKFINTPYDERFKVLDLEIMALDNDLNPVESTRSNVSNDYVTMIQLPPPPKLGYRYEVKSYLDAFNNKLVYNDPTEREREVTFLSQTKNNSSWQNIPNNVDPKSLKKIIIYKQNKFRW